MRNDWETVDLSNICLVCDNLRKPINAKERAFRIEGKKLTELYPYYGATGQVGYIDNYLTNGEYILIGEDGAPFFDKSKKVAYVITGKTWVNNHAHILFPHINSQYLLHYLNFFNYKGYVSGTTRLKLTQSSLRIIPVLIAPLPEQRAIVKRIEELFSELDNGIDNLKIAQDKLKLYRQSVLKKAFEGGLTEEWRKSQTDLPSADELLDQIKEARQKHYDEELAKWKTAVKKWETNGKEGKKPTKPRPLQISSQVVEEASHDITDSIFSKIFLGTIIDIPKYGTSKKCTLDNSGTKVLRIPNIDNGKICQNNLKYACFNSEEICHYRLKQNDILIIRSNGSVNLVGTCAIVSSKDIDCLYAGYLIKLRPNKNCLNAKFLNYLLQSHALRVQIESVARSANGINNINAKEIQNLIIPICSLKEQEQIVQEIETRLSVCDRLESDITENRKRSESLRQTILKKAFAGELLTDAELEECRNAPDYEPASVLLERIKNEQDATKTTKKKRTKKKTAKKRVRRNG